MKYIKKYEEKRKRYSPRRGDYILIRADENNTKYRELIDFINNNIGRVEYNYPYSNPNTMSNSRGLSITYFDIPDELKYLFQKSIYNGIKSYWIHFNLEDVLSFSENKKDLEIYLDAKKYNL